MSQTPDMCAPPRTASMTTGGRTLTLCSRDRRQRRRIAIDGQIRYQTGAPSGPWYGGRLTQASVHGLQLTPQPGHRLEVGGAIIGFISPQGIGQPIEFLGEVVRRITEAQGDCYAVRFLYLAEGDRHRLERAIAAKLRPTGSWQAGTQDKKEPLPRRKPATTLRVWPVA